MRECRWCHVEIEPRPDRPGVWWHNPGGLPQGYNLCIADDGGAQQAEPCATADCGHDVDADFEWPTEDGRTQCYECFQAGTDRSWWEHMTALHSEGPRDA